MQVFIFQDAVSGILKHNSKLSVGRLIGRRIDDDDVVQVIGILDEKPSDGDTGTQTSQEERPKVIGFYIMSRELPLSKVKEDINEFIKGEKSANNLLVLIVTQEGVTPNLAVYTFKDASLQEAEYNIVSFQSQIFERVKSIVEIEILAKKTIAVIGLGTGGSTVALELAKCGVGTFKLVDYDHIEVHNVSRHICGISDFGRFKTRAVKDKILQHNPNANVETYEIDVLKSPDVLANIISTSDLVIAATGSPIVNNLTNEVCLKHGVAAVYAGVWERGMGGYVMRVIPGKTACFNCVHEALLKSAPPLNRTRLIDYSTIMDPNELRAEPGLSIDVNIIALIQAKLSLLTLLTKDDKLDDIPQDYIVWFNKSYDRFKPFTCLKLYTKRKDDCAVCNYEKWLEIKVKSTEESLKDVK